MRKRFVSLAALALVPLVGGQLVAQQPAAPHSPTASGSLWTQTDWAHMAISGGRILVTSTRCGQNRICREPTADNPARQTLIVQAEPGALLINFERSDDRGQTTVSLDERKQLVICRRAASLELAAEVRYVQPANGPVTLVVGSNPERKHAAASLWQLLLAEPEVGRGHLLPILDQLRPDWKLSQQLVEIEAELIARAGQDVLPQRQAWQALVEQLASKQFAQRQAADYALRSSGQEAAAFLQQLDPSALDQEQRRRIRSILVCVADGSSDSSERVAGWLASDKRVWLALLERGDPNHRLAAARHLSRLCGRSVSFDPQASPDQREEQLVHLRALLAEN
jgi:hypothetical protein